MTLPPYQRQGYGRLLIDFSIYLKSLKIVLTILQFIFILRLLIDTIGG